MSVVLGSTTLVADSSGSSMYGEHRSRVGSVQDEVFEYSIPRADGVGEKTSGKRRRFIEVDVTYFVTSFNATETTLADTKAALTYGTLTIRGLSTEGNAQYPYCRLFDYVVRGRRGGVRNGTPVMVYDVTLIFKQVRGF